MSLFKKYYQLVESTALTRYYRSKGLEPPKKLSIYEQLEKYKDDLDVYISFTLIKKLGINPKTDFNSPIGFYSYPLNLIWKNFDHLNKKIRIPWAIHMPYIHVFKPKENANGLFIDKYDENDFKKDIQKIRDSNVFDEDKIDFLLTQTDRARVQTTPGIIWFITYALTIKKKLDEFKKIISEIKGITSFVGDSPGSIILWTKILRGILGYDYVVDNDKGVIHRNEATQAVFFSTSSIKIIDVIFNHSSINAINNHWIYDKKNKISKNAKFEIGVEGDELYDKLVDDQFIFNWYSGDWYDGTWEWGRWKSGTWWKGTWKAGSFSKGIWKDGTWKNGGFGGYVHEDAIWEKGIWEYGNFNKGIWKDGTWKNGHFQGGIWEGGTWLKGYWKSGAWLGGYDKFGNYHPEGDSPDKWSLNINGAFISDAKISKDAIYKYTDIGKALWEDGTWYDGTWYDGTWKNGTWKNGTWKFGYWENGKWENGTWEKGFWSGGYDKYGKYHPQGDSPNKWKN